MSHITIKLRPQKLLQTEQKAKTFAGTRTQTKNAVEACPKCLTRTSYNL